MEAGKCKIKVLTGALSGEGLVSAYKALFLMLSPGGPRLCCHMVERQTPSSPLMGH
jgi:hypothetical protein